jgi:hypothetical protein
MGHALRSFVGIDQEFSLPRLAIMVVYVVGVLLMVGRKQIQSIKN